MTNEPYNKTEGMEKPELAEFPLWGLAGESENLPENPAVGAYRDAADGSMQ